MRVMICLWLAFFAGLGCAKVSVQAPKDPIKVDISMRLDIYQHIENDIDQIENMISGPGSDKKGPQSFLDFGVTEAYAAEGLSPEVEAAVIRRKSRYSELNSLQAQGILGENRMGLLELRKTGAKISFPMNDENSDRMIIYQAVAQKNGSSVEEVQKLYAKRLQSDAPAGTPIEIEISNQDTFEWTIKN